MLQIVPARAVQAALRQIVSEMTCNALPWRAAGFTARRKVLMAALAQVMELRLQQINDSLIGDMTIHARLDAGVIDVVVVTIDTADRVVVGVREAHRQNPCSAAVMKVALWQVGRQWRAEDQNPRNQRDRYCDTRLHGVTLRIAANTTAPAKQTTRKPATEADLTLDTAMPGRRKVAPIAIDTRSTAWYHVCR